MNNNFKKKLTFKTGLVLFVVIAIFLGVAYAFVGILLTGAKQVVINAGVLDLVFEEENAITITDAFPMYDEVGMIQEDVFEFRLVNKTSNPTNYILKLSKITADNELSSSDVKYYLTKEGVGEPKLLSSLPTSGVVDKGSIAGNDTIDYSLRLWIDSEVTDNDAIAGKSLSYKVSVEAGRYMPYQVRYGELYSVTLEGMQLGVVLNEDGSGIFYNNYVIAEEFEAGSFAFADNNIISSTLSFEISEDGTELYVEADGLSVTLGLIEKGGDILFGQSYSVTIDSGSVNAVFNEDGSVVITSPNGSETMPAGSVYYNDGNIYTSATGELMGYTMDDGNIICAQGMLLKYKPFGTTKIHNDEYVLDKRISTDSNIPIYHITDKFYTKGDLLDSYLVFQSKSTGLVDAYYLSSDFIDSNTDDDGVMYFRSAALWLPMFFVPEGHVYEEPYSDVLVEKGTYFFDQLSMIGVDYSPFNIVVSKSIDNPILLETKNNSEAESYDMDLTDAENILYHVSDEYFEVDELLNSTLIEINADMPITRITSDKITRISENVYKIDDSFLYGRYFCKEDTYLDTDGDGVDDKYYKKGIYVEASSPSDSIGMKIVKYQD